MRLFFPKISKSRRGETKKNLFTISRDKSRSRPRDWFKVDTRFDSLFFHQFRRLLEQYRTCWNCLFNSNAVTQETIFSSIPHSPKQKEGYRDGSPEIHHRTIVNTLVVGNLYWRRQRAFRNLQ